MNEKEKAKLINELQAMRENFFDEETKVLGGYSQEIHPSRAASALREMNRLRQYQLTITKVLELLMGVK